MKLKSIATITKEYGIPWLMFRTLYGMKLKLMNCSGIFEQCFEKKVDIKRLDIFQVPVVQLENFYKEMTSQEQKALMKEADEACEGVVRGFSSVKLDYGNPVSWQLNPLTGESCDKNQKWFRIPDFDPQRGDIKVIWEISRFSHFITIARAYMLTRDEKYYRAFSEQLAGWVENNRYSYGANYKCGQECSIRMINLLLTTSVFSHYGLLGNSDWDNVKKVVEGSVKKIESNFFYAYRCIKNNHTISELVGMIVGALCQENHEKLTKAYKMLEKVVKEQFSEDGGYCQNSFNYQRVALQMLEIIYALEEKTDMSLGDEAKRRVYESAMMLYQVQEEKSGDVPNYGSNDGALIFPLSSCGYRDFRPVVNAISGLQKQQFLYPSGLWAEEYLWLSDKKCSQININKRTKFFQTAGIYSYVGQSSKLMIIFQQLKKRPAQMDQLHVDIWSRGKNIFCDSGTYSYASALGNELLATSGHNTVKVENKEQMRRRPPFLLYDWPECRVLCVSENEFEGRMISKEGYAHQRRIIYKDSGIEIVDQVNSEEDGFYVFFHTPYEVMLEKDKCYIIDSGEKLAVLQTTGEIQILESYRSLYYLKKEKIKKIQISTKTGGVTTEITMLGGNKDD